MGEDYFFNSFLTAYGVFPLRPDVGGVEIME
jgi:hypothetical protein